MSMARRRDKYISWDKANKAWVARFGGLKKQSSLKWKVENWLEQEKTKKEAEGWDASELPHDHRIDAIKALEVLPEGYTLEDAARFFADHLGRTTRVLTIADAIAGFLEAKKNESETHKRDLTTRLNRWRSVLDEEISASSTRAVSSVTSSELAIFSQQFRAQNYINWRSVFSNFFGWCVKTGASSHNPATALEVGKRIKRRPTIMTTSTFSDLLSKALAHRRSDVLAWLTFGGLCGLRPFEALRIHWSAVQWETDEIRIEPEVSKTKRARIVPIQPSGLKWLEMAFEAAGRPSEQVMPPESTWSNRWRRWRKKNHDFQWWVGKDDVLRHSYGTYRAAILRNSHTVAEEMGTSVEMVRTHYDAVVSPSVARYWWSINPTKS